MASRRADFCRSHLPRTPHASGSSFDDLSDRMWEMCNEMSSQQFFRSHAPSEWAPRVNVYEVPDRYLLCVELAGMPREQIDVRVDGKVLRISGSRSRPSLPGDPQDVSVHVMEIDSGRFCRKVPLPPDVNTEKIAAVYRHGFLWITLTRLGDKSDEGGA